MTYIGIAGIAVKVLFVSSAINLIICISCAVLIFFCTTRTERIDIEPNNATERLENITIENNIFDPPFAVISEYKLNVRYTVTFDRQLSDDERSEVHNMLQTEGVEKVRERYPEALVTIGE
jgi:hypothetical protein